MNNSLAEVHPELVSEWSEKNLLLTPDDITFGSNKKVWWKGACSHEYTTIDELFDLWANMKRGLKNNTFENYKYMYNTFVRPVIGSKRISTLKKSDIKKYYNYLVDERNLKPSTIDNIHTVLHQVLQIAVDDDFIRNNPSDNVLRELKKAHCFQSEKRRALTKPEQELFLNFLKTHPAYEHWYPVFAVMIGTGLRVGEVTGLRWCDIDMESGMIDVNHTLVYYDHRTEGSKSGCYFNVNAPRYKAAALHRPYERWNQADSPRRV